MFSYQIHHYYPPRVNVGNAVLINNIVQMKPIISAPGVNIWYGILISTVVQMKPIISAPGVNIWYGI
jgi:hypothetical protein